MGVDELKDGISHWLIDLFFSHQEMNDGRNPADGMKFDSFLGKDFPTSLFAVDEHDCIAHGKTYCCEGIDRFENALAGGDYVLDEEAALPGGENALDLFRGAVVFFFFAPQNKRDVMLDRDRGCKGQGGVGNAAKKIKAPRSHRIIERFRDCYKQFWI
jgi:hypothetical protein